MARKIICTLLAAVLLVTAVSGCGREENVPVNVYRTEYLKLPDEVMAVQVVLMDDGAVFFDIETTAVVFADYDGNIQSIVELDLPETEPIHSLDFDAESGFTYVQTSEAFYTIDPAGNLTCEPTDEAPEMVFRISEEKLDIIRDAINLADYYKKESELLDAIFAQNGDIICAFHDGEFIVRDIIRFIPIDPDQPPPPTEKTTITLYALELNYWLIPCIAEFNRSNAEYTIDAKVFLNDAIDYDAALRNLNTALTAGDIPDIIIYDNIMSVKKHADSGLLADLYEIMDSDPDFNIYDYLPNAFTASELDGRLYSIFPQFDVITAAARTSDVGAGLGWSLDEFEEFANKANTAYISAFYAGEPTRALVTSQEDFLTDMSYKLFINPVTGEVDFDRSVFMKLLKIAEHFPPENVDITYRGENPFERSIGPEGPLMWLDSPGNFLHSTFRLRPYFGEEFIYKGYPGVSGSGSFFDPPYRFAITAQSNNRDGAWTFIKYMLDDSEYWRFPININRLERAAEKAKNDIPLTVVTAPGEDTWTITVAGILDEDISATMELIKSLEHVLLYDQTITAIIETEIKAYLAGQCTAQQAADVIESKLEIYYAESS